MTPVLREREREQEWSPARKFLPLIMGKDLAELEKEDISKMELFEKGLQNELKSEDTIDEAITKIVKMALAAEFGASLVAAKGAEGMVNTIVRGIMGDTTLRKQALIILDRYAR